jgi:hypothetical protein
VTFIGMRSGHSEGQGTATHREPRKEAGGTKANLHDIPLARKSDVESPIPGSIGSTRKYRQHEMLEYAVLTGIA